jgi:hypothetical protein
MELSFIGGKDFPRKRCVLTRFHTGDGHDKTSEIGRTLVADHVRNGAWVSPFHLSRDLRAAMHLQIVEAGGQLNRRYVANEPHCWGNVDRASRKSRCRWNRPRGWMLSVQVFGPGGTYRSRIFWIEGRRMGRCEGATAEKAVPFLSNAHRSYSLFCFAALNPFCGADRSRSGPFTQGKLGGQEKLGGDSIT